MTQEEKNLYLADWHKTQEQHSGAFLPFYRDPHIMWIDPFRIFGNLYYVGDKRVCVHLIDTGDGLILIDSGYQHTIHMLLHSIWKLGFRPDDIRYVVHTHEHFDHFGATNELVGLFHCKTFLSRIGAEDLKRHPEHGVLSAGANPYAYLIQPDELLEDGSHIALGNTDILCRHTPGHSLGTLSFFFDVTDGKTVYRAGLFGGAGMITLHKGNLIEAGLPLDMPQQFLRSIEQVYHEPVDITLGTHPPQNQTLEKRAQMLEHPEKNPFIDKTAWTEQLDVMTELINQLLAREKKLWEDHYDTAEQ